jgi:uncharacterized membrane protein YkvA (DUF1232 family)
MSLLGIIMKFLKNTFAFFGDPSVSIFHKGVGILALVYVLSPIDLIPDAIPLLGWLDDIGVVALVAGHLVRRIHVLTSSSSHSFAAFES